MKAKAAPRSATRTFFALSALGLFCALAFLASQAAAQESAKAAMTGAPTVATPAAPATTAAQPAPEVVTEQQEEIDYGPVQVGDATQALMNWQSSGELASPTARPIAGVVANRSYERYLKSFEFPIPERMSSIVKSSSSSGSSTK